MPRIPGFGGNISPKTLVVFLVIPMIAIAIILRIVFSFVPPSRPALLPEAEGMIESSSVADAQEHTAMRIAMPADLLGSAIYVIGAYTKDAGTLPAGSVIVNLAKDNHRFVEIVERPSTALPDVLNDYRPSQSLPVALGNGTGTMLTIPSKHIACVSESEKWKLPGYCEISRVLVFEADGTVISIGADASHATDGELITMAKDILGPAASPEGIEGSRKEVPTTFTFKDAGIDPLFDAEKNLAIVRGIETNGSRRFVTFDPVETIDCRSLATTNPLPKECPEDMEAEGLTAAELFPVSNPDASTRTIEMAADAGPYYFQTPTDGSERFWTTVGTVGTQLFHVTVDAGIVTKVAEHPTP